LLFPIFDASTGALQLFGCGALHNSYQPLAVFGPVSLKTQKDNPPASARMKSTESHPPCFLRRYSKTELSKSFGQYFEKLYGIFTVLKGADKIVCVYRGSAVDSYCFSKLKLKVNGRLLSRYSKNFSLSRLLLNTFFRSLPREVT